MEVGKTRHATELLRWGLLTLVVLVPWALASSKNKSKGHVFSGLANNTARDRARHAGVCRMVGWPIGRLGYEGDVDKKILLSGGNRASWTSHLEAKFLLDFSLLTVRVKAREAAMVGIDFVLGFGENSMSRVASASPSKYS